MDITLYRTMFFINYELKLISKRVKIYGHNIGEAVLSQIGISASVLRRRLDRYQDKYGVRPRSVMQTIRYLEMTGSWDLMIQFFPVRKRKKRKISPRNSKEKLI